MTVDKVHPWIQRCLDENGWNSWGVDKILGQGSWSVAVLLVKGGRQCVLLANRPDAPQINKPGVTGIFQLYQSAAKIRNSCRKVGLPVARTISGPREWTGGAAVLLSRVPGRDMEHMLDNPNLDASAIARSVASIVRDSQVLGSAHTQHKSGFGNHIFGHRPRHNCSVAAWSMCISPLLGVDAGSDELIERLGHVVRASFVDVTRTTQIWDVGDRNIMLDEQGEVVGLVDQVDLFTGDAMMVPGFSMAMLGDIHNWGMIEAYSKAWRSAWEMTPEQWFRVRLHRLASHGRFVGKTWKANHTLLSVLQQPQELAKWQENTRKLLSEWDA